jgi:hypothetical protein
MEIAAVGIQARRLGRNDPALRQLVEPTHIHLPAQFLIPVTGVSRKTSANNGTQIVPIK